MLWIEQSVVQNCKWRLCSRRCVLIGSQECAQLGWSDTEHSLKQSWLTEHWFPHSRDPTRHLFSSAQSCTSVIIWTQNICGNNSGVGKIMVRPIILFWRCGVHPSIFFKRFCKMWTIFLSLYWTCYNSGSVFYVFCFTGGTGSMWDLSSPTSNWAWTPCTGRWRLNH